MLVAASSTQDIQFASCGKSVCGYSRARLFPQVWPMPHILGFDGAPRYTLAVYFNVGKVEFAWSPRTPNAKPRREGRGCKSTGVERGDRMILLALFLFLLLTRTKRTKLKIEIDL
jgi:hypothetical protein